MAKKQPPARSIEESAATVTTVTDALMKATSEHAGLASNRTRLFAQLAAARSRLGKAEAEAEADRLTGHAVDSSAIRAIEREIEEIEAKVEATSTDKSEALVSVLRDRLQRDRDALDAAFVHASTAFDQKAMGRVKAALAELHGALRDLRGTRLWPPNPQEIRFSIDGLPSTLDAIEPVAADPETEKFVQLLATLERADRAIARARA